MLRLFSLLLKCIFYFVFGYIPLLIVCMVVSTGITAFIVQMIDYCYGSMECLLHGMIMFTVGPVVGFEVSVVLASVFVWQKFRRPKQKCKREI